MKYTDLEFLGAIKPYVIADMQNSGILASLTAAQGFIESNKGCSKLSQQPNNNIFGIKGSYAGNSVRMLTTEYYNGVAVRVYANFRKYPSWKESIADHSDMFNRMKRYANLRGLKDYRLACRYVHEDGYATSPVYASSLLGIIETYQLYEWDVEAGADPVAQEPREPLPVLRFGDISKDVLAWQIFLNQNGYQCGKEDGIFGKCTLEAVKQWQQAHIDKCKVVDGIIGRDTWASIGIY